MATPPGSSAIRVAGLRQSYGDWPVLWDLDLQVEWGQSLVLFGANGAGKTTLLRVLATQSRPEAGQVLVAGYDHRRQAQAIRRNIGVVGHSGFLYEDLTCRENLVFYGRLFRVGDIRGRVQAVLSRVGLLQRADQRVRTLSHGMQKRLAIARAILHQPAILLLDEPEGGLDRESLVMLKGLLEEWTGLGRTAIMTTHNIELGLAWAHRAAVLCNGKLHFQEHSGGLDPSAWQRLVAAATARGPGQPLGPQP